MLRYISSYRTRFSELRKAVSSLKCYIDPSGYGNPYKPLNDYQKQGTVIKFSSRISRRVMFGNF